MAIILFREHESNLHETFQPKVESDRKFDLFGPKVDFVPTFTAKDMLRAVDFDSQVSGASTKVPLRLAHDLYC